MNGNYIIIGGGAAGVFAALVIAEHGGKPVILEKNDYIGRKLRITGKGRCNLTNNCDTDTLIAKIPRSGRFLYSAFSRCSPQDVMERFEAMGVPLKTERGNRVFPVSDKATDVCEALKKAIKNAGIPVIRTKALKLITENGRCTGVECADGKVYSGKAVLIATGGVSYPVTGSDGDGYAFAKKAGHTIVKPVPSLVPLTTKEKTLSSADGLTLKNIRLKITEGNKCRFEEQGEITIMSYGIAGPLTLSASALLTAPSKGQYTASIDLKPALTEKQLDARLLREFEQSKNGILGNVLRKLLPPQLIAPVCLLSNVPPDIKVSIVTKAQRSSIIRTLKAVTLTVSGTRPIEEAIVTRGGVSVKEINAKTMESKLLTGLYFAGEVIDADGYTGGFNLQIAFSTAYSAAIAMTAAADIK